MASASGRPDASYLRMPAAALRAALDASRASRLSVSERCCSSSCCACQVKANHNRHAMHLHLQLHLAVTIRPRRPPPFQPPPFPHPFSLLPSPILPASRLYPPCPLHSISPSSAPARASVRARVAVAVAAGRRPAVQRSRTSRTALVPFALVPFAACWWGARSLRGRLGRSRCKCQNISKYMQVQ